MDLIIKLLGKLFKSGRMRLKGDKMKRIILILLFVFIASLSLAKDLDLTYEIQTNNDQYVINKNALSAKTGNVDRRVDDLGDVVFVVLTVVFVVGTIILYIALFERGEPLPPRVVDS